jgi:hypothetical protein
MSVFDAPKIMWYRSTLCSGGDCVEVAVVEDTTTDTEDSGAAVFLMRNSTNPEEILRLTSIEWAAFITDIKEGTDL